MKTRGKNSGGRPELCGGMPRNAKDHGLPPEAKKGQEGSAQSLGGKMVLTTP